MGTTNPLPSPVEDEFHRRFDDEKTRKYSFLLLYHHAYPVSLSYPATTWVENTA